MHEPATDIIYIDETTFHLWMPPARVWIKRGMRVELPDQRGQSISMIGALSVHHGLALTHVFLGSNTVDSFLPFIQRLKRLHPFQKRIVVMDNLSVHHCKVVQQEFDGERFRWQFLPPQSCELNLIERVWNLIKG